MIFSIFAFGFVVSQINENDTNVTRSVAVESRRYKSDMVNMFGEMETDFDWEEGLSKVFQLTNKIRALVLRANHILTWRDCEILRVRFWHPLKNLSKIPKQQCLSNSKKSNRTGSQRMSFYIVVLLQGVFHSRFCNDLSTQRNHDCRRLSYLWSTFGLGINDIVLVHKIKYSAVCHLQQFKPGIHGLNRTSTEKILDQLGPGPARTSSDQLGPARTRTDKI